HVAAGTVTEDVAFDALLSGHHVRGRARGMSGPPPLRPPRSTVRPPAGAAPPPKTPRGPAARPGMIAG
ncbi:hypothetical protein AB0D08_12425, partial [Kitasatospora sp. NPDC048540]